MSELKKYIMPAVKFIGGWTVVFCLLVPLYPGILRNILLHLQNF